MDQNMIGGNNCPFTCKLKALLFTQQINKIYLYLGITRYEPLSPNIVDSIIGEDFIFYKRADSKLNPQKCRLKYK